VNARTLVTIILLPPPHDDLFNINEPVSLRRHQCLPPNRPRVLAASRRHPLLQPERQGSTLGGTCARGAWWGPVHIPSTGKYHKSAPSISMRGYHQQDAQPSFPGSAPRAAPSSNHMLARIIFIRTNSLHSWLWTAKSAGMAVPKSTPCLNPLLRQCDAPIPHQHNYQHSQQYTR